MKQRYDKDYFGYNMVWFFGVVEDRQDPLKLGRIRVRCHSWHSSDKQKQPTSSLPWAQCIQDITNASISGIGRSPTGILEGSWVFGFFMDGDDAQKPMIIGTLAGIPQNLPDSTSGFNDPDARYPNIINEPDTSRLSRNETPDLSSVNSNNYIYTVHLKKHPGRDESVSIANNITTWSEPNNPYNARYPYNNVWQTEAGHVIELDDSSGSERIHIYHATGTFIEIDSNGTKVSKTIGDQYEILERNGYLHVKGNISITVDGDTNIYTKNNMNIDVDGNLNVKVKNDFNLDVSGSTKITTKESIQLLANSMIFQSNDGDIEYYTNGKFNLYAIDQVNMLSDENINIDSDNIYMNSDKAITAAKTGLSLPGNRKTVSPIVLSPLIEINRNDLFAIYYDDEYAQNSTPPETYIQEIISAGAGTRAQLEDIPAIPTLKIDLDETINPVIAPVNTQPDNTISNVNEFADTYKLSTNFNLGQLSSRAVVSKYRVRDQVGLTKAEIVQNLKGVAENILEPILAKYPDMIITSGFRIGEGRSQHFKGKAVDIQFRNASKRDYFERAKIIKGLISYDQMLLEFKNTGTGLPWIHISFDFNGNRNQILTFFNHKNHSSGLTQLA